MRPSRLFLAGLFGLVGVIWIGQGLGAIGGSFMTGSPFWALVGAGCVGVAVATILVERRRPPA